MKTPALLMLSVLVALSHWLLLTPGPATLAQLVSKLTGSDVQHVMRLAPPPAALVPVRAMQTRHIESPAAAPVVKALQAVRVEPLQASASDRTPPSARPSARASAPPPAPPGASQTALRPQEAAPETGPTPEAAPSGVDVNANTTITTATAVAALSPGAADAGAQTLAPQKEELVSLPSQLGPPPTVQRISQLQLPKPARLNYDITGQSRGLGYRASGVLDWQLDGSRYDARMIASVFFLGSRTLSSQGEVNTDGLAPTRFSDKARSEQAAHFEAAKGKITFSANTPDAPWQRGAQDRLSVFFQLAGILAGQPERLAPGTRIPVYTAGARSADTWTFRVDDLENLSLPAGTMAALKLTRQSRLEHDQMVEIWFAPSLSYWPVRIKVTQPNGDFVDQQLASLTTP